MTKSTTTKAKADKKIDVIDEVIENPEIKSEKTLKLPKDKNPKGDRYYEAVGRRKTSIARVRLFTKGQGIIVNDKDYKEYFPTDLLQKMAEASLKKMKSLDRFKITAKVSGGGLKSQAEAIRHGVARVLVIFNLDFKKRLRRAGYLTRDPRMKERKKYGLKRARKSPRWSKR